MTNLIKPKISLMMTSINKSLCTRDKSAVLHANQYVYFSLSLLHQHLLGKNYTSSKLNSFYLIN